LHPQKLFRAFLAVPYGQPTHIHVMFTFFVTKHVFLQLTFWLVSAIAGCLWLKASLCNHENLVNTVMGKEEGKWIITLCWRR